MSSELDFKHRVVFKKSALKRSGKKAKKKVYKAAGEAKIENADRKRKLTNEQVKVARYLAEFFSIKTMAEKFECSYDCMYNAVKGNTYKHLNELAKPKK